MSFTALHRSLDAWAREYATAFFEGISCSLRATCEAARHLSSTMRKFAAATGRCALLAARFSVRMRQSVARTAPRSGGAIRRYRAARREIAVNLALQGGGAHGAFTWGVLDDLLESERIGFPAISGSSAGAMNAAVLASGLMEGGGRQARERLERYWRDVGALAPASIGPASIGIAPEIVADSVARSIESVGRLISPYQANPFNLNPMRGIVERHIDFDALRSPCAPRLFIAATDIETAAPRIFTNREMSADAILASACLPQLQQAVEIDGHWYWDGGYSSNPPLLPLIGAGKTLDTLIVQILPSRADDPPKDSLSISARRALVAFAGPLQRELAEVARSKALARSGVTIGGLSKARAARHRLHRIEAPDLGRRFGRVSAFSPERAFLAAMKRIGRAEAQEWRELYLPLVGKQQTLRMAA